MALKKMNQKHMSAAGLALLVLAQTGCVATVEHPRPPEQVVYVEAPPPPPRLEIQPAPPGPPERWVWQKGHWRWLSGQYRWTSGRWVERPAHVSEWMAPHWQPRPEGGYVFIEGTWR